jgi:very-short-patch-repair endonuclease
MKLTSVLVPLLGVLAFIGVAYFIARRRSGGGEGPWPFVVRKPMSVPEQILYFRLLESLPEHIVLAQVQVSRFLGVKRGHAVQGWQNRINRLSVDFLVLKKDSTVVAAIELDDRTHQRSDRLAADSRKNRALSAAGVQLIRWSVADMPGTEEIRSKLTGPHYAQTYQSVSST